MKKSKIALLNEEFRELVQKMLLEDGEVTPTLAIIAEKIGETEEKKKDHLMICPMPSEALATSHTKTVLVEKIFPDMGLKLKKDGLNIIGIIFAYIGMVKTVPEDMLKEKDAEEITSEDVKDLESTEFLFFNYQSATENTFKAFKVKREGKAVNQEGDLVDIVKLIRSTKFSAPDAAVGGLFSNTYKQLTKHL